MKQQNGSGSHDEGTSDIEITYQIVMIHPLGYNHSEVFREVAETLMYGLQSLGYTATITENEFSDVTVNIILGAHLITEDQIDNIPLSSIIYNLEQIDPKSMLTATTFRIFKMFTVWDYSERNIEKLRIMGCDNPIYHVPIGYVPQLTSITRSPVQDIDVLFYGSMNPRREKIIDELRTRGLHVVTLFGAYGQERDAVISRAKVIINIHFYDSSIVEMVRISYLLANHKAVVAECNEDTEFADDLKIAVGLAPYNKLVDTCIELVKNDEKRQLLEEDGFAWFSMRKESSILREALLKSKSTTDKVQKFPTKINLGSGKNWQKAYLNIDINEYWQPDIVADISTDFPLNKMVNTERFGSILVKEGSFDEIIANDVLEHIRELIAAMTMCLQLLKVGGIFKIKVPYDLSYGAWQDPTHVRTFNEKSWLYYTDWYWYIGWTEAKFDLIENTFKLSSLGLEMQRQNIPLATILSSPRAVDEMEVVLRKRAVTDDEKKAAACYVNH